MEGNAFLDQNGEKGYFLTMFGPLNFLKQNLIPILSSFFHTVSLNTYFFRGGGDLAQTPLFCLSPVMVFLRVFFCDIACE